MWRAMAASGFAPEYESHAGDVCDSAEIVVDAYRTLKKAAVQETSTEEPNC
jgi:hypothetical protein